MNVDDLEARLTELELRYMEQQHVIDTLDALVQEQDAQIQQLLKKIEMMRQMMQNQPDDRDPSEGEE